MTKALANKKVRNEYEVWKEKQPWSLASQLSRSLLTHREYESVWHHTTNQ